jgi:hypothetical protein
MPIRRKMDRLPNREFVGRHCALRAQCPAPPFLGGAARCAALLRVKRNRRRLALLAAL